MNNRTEQQRKTVKSMAGTGRRAGRRVKIASGTVRPLTYEETC